MSRARRQVGKIDHQPGYPSKMPIKPATVANFVGAPVHILRRRSRQLVAHHTTVKSLKLVLTYPTSEQQAR